MAFLDSFVNQSSAEKHARRRQHRHAQHEHGFRATPGVFTGLKDNAGTLTERTRGFAWQGLRYYDPVKRQTRPEGRENTSKKTLSASRSSSIT